MYTKLNHDVWQRGALGSSAQEVYEGLLRKKEAISVAQIVEMTGRCRQTVKNALDRLKEVELVFPEGAYWYAVQVDPSRLDEIAQIRGTFGRTEQRRQKYQQEREKYAAWRLFRGR